MRRKVIAGNWKMNMLPNDTISFIEEFAPLVKDTENEVILCVPYTDLFYALLNAQGTNIKIGAQNMHWEDEGAYTGEISGKMLKSIGVEYVIIGHSERRQYFNETDETVNKKIKTAFKYGLKQVKNTIIAYEPIWAIGTGKVATSTDANNSIKAIREEIKSIYGQDVSESVIIQYGGSVKSTSAKELFTTSDIDGGLVGGASLKAEEFAGIVNYEK